jgi:hypothetical protein
MPGVHDYTSGYCNISQGQDTLGPWNEGSCLKFIDDPQPAVDGQGGTARVGVNQADVGRPQGDRGTDCFRSVKRPCHGRGDRLGSDELNLLANMHEAGNPGGSIRCGLPIEPQVWGTGQ